MNLLANPSSYTYTGEIVDIELDSISFNDKY